MKAISEKAEVAAAKEFFDAEGRPVPLDVAIPAAVKAAAETLGECWRDLDYLPRRLREIANVIDHNVEMLSEDDSALLRHIADSTEQVEGRFTVDEIREQLASDEAITRLLDRRNVGWQEEDPEVPTPMRERVRWELEAVAEHFAALPSPEPKDTAPAQPLEEVTATSSALIRSDDLTADEGPWVRFEDHRQRLAEVERELGECDEALRTVEAACVEARTERDDALAQVKDQHLEVRDEALNHGTTMDEWAEANTRAEQAEQRLQEVRGPEAIARAVVALERLEETERQSKRKVSLEEIAAAAVAAALGTENPYVGWKWVDPASLSQSTGEECEPEDTECRCTWDNIGAAEGIVRYDDRCPVHGLAAIEREEAAADADCTKRQPEGEGPQADLKWRRTRPGISTRLDERPQG